MSQPPYLSRRAAAEYIRVRWGIRCSEKTLAKLACIGGGPVYRLCGRTPLYAPPDSTLSLNRRSASRSARPRSTRMNDDVGRHEK